MLQNQPLSTFHMQATNGFLDFDVRAKTLAEADAIMHRLYMYMNSTSMAPAEITEQFPEITLKFVCLWRPTWKAGGTAEGA